MAVVYLAIWRTTVRLGCATKAYVRRVNDPFQSAKLLTHTCAGAACIDRAFANLGTAAVVNIVGSIANAHSCLNCFLDLGLIERDGVGWSIAIEAGKCTTCQRQKDQNVSTHLESRQYKLIFMFNWDVRSKGWDDTRDEKGRSEQKCLRDWRG